MVHGYELLFYRVSSWLSHSKARWMVAVFGFEAEHMGKASLLAAGHWMGGTTLLGNMWTFVLLFSSPQLILWAASLLALQKIHFAPITGW